MFAVKYQNLSQKVQYQYGLKLLELIDIKEGLKVLDIGCGSGNHVAFVSSKVGESGKVIGIDPDCERIKAAKEQYKDLKNAEFHLCKSIEFPIEDQPCYDVVYSNTALHWITDEEKVKTFERVHKSLKDDGVFLFIATLTLPENYVAMLEHAPEKTRQSIFNSLDFCPHERYEEIAQNAGFEIKSSRDIFYVGEPMDVDSYFDWVEATLYGKYDTSKMDRSKVKIRLFENGLVDHRSRVSEIVLVKKQ